MAVQVEVTINKFGEVEVHVTGMKGQQCLLLTAELEAALGGQVERRLTDEYYEVKATDSQKDPLLEGY